MRLLSPPLFTVLLTVLSSTRSGPPRFPQRSDQDLREALEHRIAAQPGAEVALWFEDLASGRTLGIADTLSFHAASTMKVPVMFELFRRADEGTLDLDDRIPLVGHFTSIVDGSSYALNPADDSDDALYDRIGAPISYHELNERMIVRSSNLATTVLIERLDPTRVTAFARSLGGDGPPAIRILRRNSRYNRCKPRRS